MFSFEKDPRKILMAEDHARERKKPFYAKTKVSMFASKYVHIDEYHFLTIINYVCVVSNDCEEKNGVELVHVKDYCMHLAMKNK